MSTQEKIKDTNLGSWLKEKAPGIFKVAGDLLPDRGGLGLVKRLLANDSSVDPKESEAVLNAEVEFQNNVSRRWEADMASDVKIAKIIRPSIMISLMVFFLVVMVWDGLDASFMPRESYISLLEILMLTVFGAYFAGRTIEKIRK